MKFKHFKYPEQTPRTRKAMIDFLTSHFRYNTLNSWNASTSYANRTKVHHLNLSRDEERACLSMLAVESSWNQSGYNRILNQFGETYDYGWQIGTNGKSGGYLVLLQGKREPSEYKSECLDCGQLNYRADTLICGRCGAEAMASYTGSRIIAYPSRSLDMGESFEDWTTGDIAERVTLVRDFDQTCEKAVAAYVRYAMRHTVEKKTIQVPRQILVAVARNGA